MLCSSMFPIAARFKSDGKHLSLKDDHMERAFPVKDIISATNNSVSTLSEQDIMYT